MIKRARCSRGIITSTHWRNQSVMTASAVATMPRINWPPPRQSPITVTSHNVAADDHVAFLDDRAAADETNAGQNAQRQAHDIHHGKGSRGLPGLRQQDVGL